MVRTLRMITDIVVVTVVVFVIRITHIIIILDLLDSGIRIHGDHHVHGVVILGTSSVPLALIIRGVQSIIIITDPCRTDLTHTACTMTARARIVTPLLPVHWSDDSLTTVQTLIV
jgi:hypothetical protein